MLETIDARASIGRPPGDLRDWTYRRNPRAGVETWAHPDLPDGLSLLAVTRTPDGYRLRMEGNLITALHGPWAAAGTLASDEIPGATTALLGLAEDSVGVPLPSPSEWDVHRLDPSRTVRLPEGLTAREVVDAALLAWSVLPSRNVSLHKRETCTRVITKWRSHSVYDKSEDMRRKGQPVQHGLLRLEARLRPRAAKSRAFASFRPTLALTDADLETAMRELDLLASSINSVAASSDLMLTRALVAAGCPANSAVRICTTTRLVSAFGVRILNDLGVDERTARRWVAEVRKWQELVSTEDLEGQMIGAVRAWDTVRAEDVAAAPVGPDAARKARSAGTAAGPRSSAADSSGGDS